MGGERSQKLSLGGEVHSSPGHQRYQALNVITEQYSYHRSSFPSSAGWMAGFLCHKKG